MGLFTMDAGAKIPQKWHYKVRSFVRGFTRLSLELWLKIDYYYFARLAGQLVASTVCWAE
jgi:hypothetical protein